MTVRSLATSLFLCSGLLAAPAVAGQSVLPAELGWCMSRDEVNERLAKITELSEGVLEASAEAFGIRGTITAVMDEAQLVTARFRCFETEQNFAAIRKALTALHGEGRTRDRAREGMGRNMIIDWEVDADQTLQLKVSSEQIYVSWEVPSSHCFEYEKRKAGLSAAEQADLAASQPSQTIKFDPFAEDIEDVDARKQETDDAKKSKTVKAEEKRKTDEPPPADTEIDW